jgi:hypothetical protein
MEMNSKETKNVKKENKSIIDLGGFVILMGYLDTILKCFGLDEPYRIFITFIVLTIRLFWWDKNRSASDGTLTLPCFTLLLLKKFLLVLTNKKGTLL